MTEKTEQKNKWWTIAMAAASLLLSAIVFTYNAFSPRETESRITATESSIEDLEGDVSDLEEKFERMHPPEK